MSQLGIGGLDLSGTKAIQEFGPGVGIAGGNCGGVTRAVQAAVGIAGDLHGRPGRAALGIAGNAGYVADSASRQAIRRVAQADVPAVFVLSWIYGVTTGRQGPMRWRQSLLRDENGQPARIDGQRVWLPNFELIYGVKHRRLPVFMDSCFVQVYLKGSMPLRDRTLEKTIRAAEIIEPDMLFNHDEPDPARCQRNFVVLRDRFGDKVIPVLQVPAHWQVGLSIRANAKAMVKSAEWNFYEKLIGPGGIIALGGLNGFTALPREHRAELAWWVCDYTGFERPIWLLGQASFVVLNGLGRFLISRGPLKGQRLLKLVYSDGATWLLDATLNRMVVLHDHPNGQLLHMLHLRDNTRHFFSTEDCMAANLRAQIAAYRGDIKFPLSEANLPREDDPAAFAQLRLDLFGEQFADRRGFVKGGEWLVGRVDGGAE